RARTTAWSRSTARRASASSGSPPRPTTTTTGATTTARSATRWAATSERSTAMTTTRLAFVLSLGLASLAAAADQPAVTAGAVAPGAAYEPPPAFAPARVSRAHVRTIAVTDGRASVGLPVTGAPRLLVWAVASPRAGLAAPARPPRGPTH